MSQRVVLLGHRIGYSASPAIHAAGFAAIGLDASYELVDVPAERLAAAIAGLRANGCIGANVTRPHKVAICALMDDAAPEVQRLGAANTIVREGNRLVAHNTDISAIAAELSELGDGFRAAVVLGVGGAGRAAHAALTDAGARVAFVDRAGWSRLEASLRDADVVVNATPIGTETDVSPVPPSLLRRDLAVLDLVYRPSPTALVRAARATGAPARGGAGVLLRQAVASFERWTRCPAPIKAMRDALRAELGPAADA